MEIKLVHVTKSFGAKQVIQLPALSFKAAA